MNINVFSFFDDKGRARYPLVISRKNYEKVANLLYWKNHYAPITSISRLFSDIQNMEIRSIVVYDASVTFHVRKSSHDTQSFAL